MSAPVEHRAIARKLKALRPRVDRARAKLRDLEAQQRALYIEGGDAGMSGAAMARAEGPDHDTPSGAERVNQHVREERRKRALAKRKGKKAA